MRNGTSKYGDRYLSLGITNFFMKEAHATSVRFESGAETMTNDYYYLIIMISTEKINIDNLINIKSSIFKVEVK